MAAPALPDILIQHTKICGRLKVNFDCERRIPATCANFSSPHQISGRAGQRVPTLVHLIAYRAGRGRPAPTLVLLLTYPKGRVYSSHIWKDRGDYCPYGGYIFISFIASVGG